MGRKKEKGPAVVNWDKLEAYCQYDISLRTAASMLDMSYDTLRRRILEKYNISWGDYKKQFLDQMAFRLKNKALTMALSGDRTMLIFSLKNMAGWSDKTETTHKAESIEDLVQKSKQEDKKPKLIQGGKK